MGVAVPERLPCPVRVEPVGADMLGVVVAEEVREAVSVKRCEGTALSVWVAVAEGVPVDGLGVVVEVAVPDLV